MSVGLEGLTEALEVILCPAILCADPGGVAGVAEPQPLTTVALVGGHAPHTQPIRVADAATTQGQLSAH